jgi:2-polyprenyl-3-methyl-5-hydroxy-6-metoxy-1,4-benzoquinol methylase
MDREKVQYDFDELAHLSGGDSGSDRYDSLLLKLIPAEVKSILEIGCGTGRFTRRLATNGRRVTAVDLSPEMIARARQMISSLSISFFCGDFLEDDFGSQKFDCVISAATLHHMSAYTAVRRMKKLVAPGGMLIIHDLRSDDGVVDAARSYTAFAYDSCRRFLRTGRFRQPRAVREFWERHAAGETYLTVKEVRELTDRLLPGARVIDHWLWRYTIVWKKNS